MATINVGTVRAWCICECMRVVRGWVPVHAFMRLCVHVLMLACDYACAHAPAYNQCLFSSPFPSPFSHQSDKFSNQCNNSQDPKDGATKLLTANIGDARILLIRDGQAVQLSVDHVPDRCGNVCACFGTVYDHDHSRMHLVDAQMTVNTHVTRFGKP